MTDKSNSITVDITGVEWVFKVKKMSFFLADIYIYIYISLSLLRERKLKKSCCNIPQSIDITIL